MNIKEIKDPKFLKELDIKELKVLSNEIRNFLIESVANTGGHLSSNLGVVELTIALNNYKVTHSKKTLMGNAYHYHCFDNCLKKRISQPIYKGVYAYNQAPIACPEGNQHLCEEFRFLLCWVSG